MKISDPLGKVYTHTMFKKRSYDMRGGNGNGGEIPEDVRYLDGDNDDETNDNLQTEIAQVHHGREKMKRNHSDHKRNMNSSNSRERHTRRRDEESEDDISDDDISDNHDEIVDSEYDDEDVDDSLSTKSSRIHQNNHRGRHQSSNRSNSRPVRDSSRPRSSSRGEERDREDAISFASRASRKSLVSGGVPSRKSATSHNKKGGVKPPTASSSHHHHHLRTSSIGSASNLKRSMMGASNMLGRSSTKGSSSRSFQMPPPPPPPVHGAGGGRTTGAYTLWSTGGHSSGSPSTNTVSLKRDHKRKFNRSLCGVLLGISIVLVILGILGIIGIAVYLGVVQKLDGESVDTISIDGAIRVLSDEFSIALLNPEQPAYREKAEKYSFMISKTFEKSHLRKGFIRTTIDGFSSGSLRVFFKVLFDKRFLSRETKRKLVSNVRDVLIQEIMTISGSEFEGEAIDMDSVAFAVSLRQGEEIEEETDIEAEETYFKPEPYQQEQPTELEDNSISESEENEDIKEKASGASLDDLNDLKFQSHARDNPTMWQSIIKQKGNENMNNPSFQNNEMNSFDFMDNMVSSTTVATERMDHGNDLADGAFSVYPVYTVSPAPQNPVQRLNQQNTIPNGYTNFQSNLLPSIRDPLQQLTPVMPSVSRNDNLMHARQVHIPYGGGLHQVNRPAPSMPTRRTGFIGNREQVGNKHMSPFLEAPPPRRSWSDPNGWKISSSNLLVPTGRSVGLDFKQQQNQGQRNPLQKDRNMVSVVITPTPGHMPNTIPMNNVQSRIMHKQQMADRRSDTVVNNFQQNGNELTNGNTNNDNSLQKANIFNLHGLSTTASPTFTAQQILNQQIKNKQKAVENQQLAGNEESDDEKINEEETMVMQSSSEKNQFMQAGGQNQFWATISSRNKEALSDSNMVNKDEASGKIGTGVKIVVSDADSDVNRIAYSADASKIPSLAHNPSYANGNIPRPKLRFGPSTPSPMVMPNNNQLQAANQFMKQNNVGNTVELTVQNRMQASPIQVKNPGSSGLQVVEATVPVNQNSNSFSIGGSLVVGGKDNGMLSQQPSSMSSTITVMDNNNVIQPEIGVYPNGYDSNIIHPKQVPTGRPLQQGPHGPIVPVPRPTNTQITQTPNVPQVLMNNRKYPNGPTMIPSRLGNVGTRLHQNPGPGSYQPPITNTPNALKGQPDSGQQLIKHYLMERNNNVRQHGHQMHKKKHASFKGNDRVNEVRAGMRPSHEVNSNRASSTLPPPGNFNIHPRNNFGGKMKESADVLHHTVAQNNIEAPGINRHGFFVEDSPPIRRQDPVSAAVAGAAIPAAAALGAISSSLTPVSIFSNLLNAYATLDSKHDITSKLVESASSWLTSDGQQVQASSDFGSTPQISTTSPITLNNKINQPSTENQITEKASERSSTTTTTEDYNENDPYKAIVVESDGSLPPIRSNVGFGRPLRPKPPSDGVFRVTPSPNYHSQSSNHKIIQTPKYGVNNPHYFTDNLDNSHSETGYGPDDFVVETVKLDKDFFHQFFTSKPLLLGTNVVTSTSVKQNNSLKKRGRDASVDDNDLSQLEDPIAHSSSFIRSKLREMAKYHTHKKEGRSKEPISFKIKPSLMRTTTKRTTTTTSTTTTTNPPSIVSSKPSKSKDNVKVFKRYYIPPEVKITHNMHLPDY